MIGRQVKVVPGRTIYSLQMGIDLYEEIDEPARVINHSCNPNTGVRNNQFGSYDFIAFKDIAEGEEITFDYQTTEYISIAVSECLCSATNCRGKTRGFLYLPTAMQKKYI